MMRDNLMSHASVIGKDLVSTSNFNMQKNEKRTNRVARRAKVSAFGVFPLVSLFLISHANPVQPVLVSPSDRLQLSTSTITSSINLIASISEASWIVSG